MPRHTSYTTQSAKDFLLKYGYTTPNNYHYTNMNSKIRLYDLVNERYVNLSINQVKYRTHRATTKRPEFDSEGLNRIMNIDFQPGNISFEDRTFNNNPATLQYINTIVPKSEVDQLKDSIKQQLPNTVKQIKRALNNNSITVVYVPQDDSIAEISTKQSILLALQILKKDILSKNVNVILNSTDGDINQIRQRRFYLNENSINLLNEALFQDNIPDINDSNAEILTSYYIKNISSIVFEVTPRVRANRSNPGFFPFINVSNINLERYGIYRHMNGVNLNESCLITAIRESKQLDEQEFNRLQHFIRTRTFLLEQLPLI